MKAVDPSTKAPTLKLPETVGAAKLSAKVENDVHCDHQRPSFSPLYKPVPQSLNISTLEGVKDYFPNLAEVRVHGREVWACVCVFVAGSTALDAAEPSPLMHPSCMSSLPSKHTFPLPTPCPAAFSPSVAHMAAPQVALLDPSEPLPLMHPSRLPTPPKTHARLSSPQCLAPTGGPTGGSAGPL